MVTKATNNSSGSARAKKIPSARRKSSARVKRKSKTSAESKAKIVKDNKEFLKDNIQKNKATMQISILIFVVLLILLSAFFIYKYFIKPHNYLIQNKFYEFRLTTPAGWVGEEKIIYTEDNVSKILTECSNDKQGRGDAYEIGAFKFESQKYPDGVDFSSFLPAKFLSGILLGINISCIPNAIKEKTINSSNNESNNIVFIKNNLKYIITENIYISPADKNKEAKLKEEYKEKIGEIISSIKITK